MKITATTAVNFGPKRSVISSLLKKEQVNTGELADLVNSFLCKNNVIVNFVLLAIDEYEIETNLGNNVMFVKKHDKSTMYKSPSLDEFVVDFKVACLVSMYFMCSKACYSQQKNTDLVVVISGVLDNLLNLVNIEHSEGICKIFENRINELKSVIDPMHYIDRKYGNFIKEVVDILDLESMQFTIDDEGLSLK